MISSSPEVSELLQVPAFNKAATREDGSASRSVRYSYDVHTGVCAANELWSSHFIQRHQLSKRLCWSALVYFYVYWFKGLKKVQTGSSMTHLRLTDLRQGRRSAVKQQQHIQSGKSEILRRKTETNHHSYEFNRALSSGTTLKPPQIITKVCEENGNFRTDSGSRINSKVFGDFDSGDWKETWREMRQKLEINQWGLHRRHRLQRVRLMSGWCRADRRDRQMLNVAWCCS